MSVDPAATNPVAGPTRHASGPVPVPVPVPVPPPDRTAPDRTAPDRTAPDRTAPDRTAPAASERPVRPLPPAGPAASNGAPPRAPAPSLGRLAAPPVGPRPQARPQAAPAVPAVPVPTVPVVPAVPVPTVVPSGTGPVPASRPPTVVTPQAARALTGPGSGTAPGGRTAGPGPVVDPRAGDPSGGPAPAVTARAGGPTAPAADEAELPVQLVHITVETAQGDLDLSVADSATPAALLSIVLALAPGALRDQSVGRGGWLISRRGGGPLPGGATLSELGVVEGEVLRLSGASDAAPTPTFDDLADAVADAAGNQPHRWTLAASRRTAEVFGAAFALLALLAVSLLGPPWHHVPLVAGVLSVLLIAAATLTSRGIGQIAAAAPLALAAELTAGVCGATSVAGHRRVTEFVAPELAVGLGAIVLIGAVAVALVGRAAVSVMVVVVTALLGAVVAVIGCIWTIPRVGEGALCVLFALLLTPFIPAVAFRLARFELPPLPANAEDLAAINATVDNDKVTVRTTAAIGYVTAMATGSMFVGSAGMVLLSVGRHNLVAVVLVVATSLAVLLRARLFNSVVQRLPFLLAASVGLVSATIRVCLDVGGSAGAVWFIVAMAVAMIFSLGFAGRAGAPRTPFYGRAAELIEILLAVSLIPLIATVMGLVGLMRGLGG